MPILLKVSIVLEIKSTDDFTLLSVYRYAHPKEEYVSIALN